VRSRHRIELWLLFLAPAALVALGVASFYAEWHFTKQQPNLKALIFSQVGWVICAALAPLVFQASRRWPFTEANWPRRLALHCAFALLYWAVAGVFWEGIVPELFNMEAVAYPGAPEHSDAVVRVFRWFITSMPFGLIFYFAIVGVEHAVRYLSEARERDVRLAHMEEQVTRARLSALESRVNPHFLFNALNTIAVRARDGDAMGTARITEQLSEILRRTLRRDQAHEVTLAEELEVVQQYLGIEQARFADRLRMTFDVSDDVLDAAVPSFAIQHLAENAVRHGIARQADAGKVSVSAHRDGADLEVRVSDDGGGPGTNVNGNHGGIANTRERLQSLYGNAAVLEISAHDDGRGTVARLRLPYRELHANTGD